MKNSVIGHTLFIWRAEKDCSLSYLCTNVLDIMSTLDIPALTPNLK